MKRYSLFLATFVSAAVTAIIFLQAGRLGARSHADIASFAAAKRTPIAPNGCIDPAALRWLQGQPTHWRACLLQP